jgi:hypothetical protein
MSRAVVVFGAMRSRFSDLLDPRQARETPIGMLSSQMTYLKRGKRE